MKNNATLPLGEHYIVKQGASSITYYQLKSVLAINGLTKSDIGLYRCQAHDKLHNIQMQSENISISK